MAKPIAAYRGGIHNLIELAIRSDGVMFKRFQEKGRYGYRWSAWKYSMQFDPDLLPASVQMGFSNARKMGDGPNYPNWKNWRLPNE